jgi:hypothetical protein
MPSSRLQAAAKTWNSLPALYLRSSSNGRGLRDCGPTKASFRAFSRGKAKRSRLVVPTEADATELLQRMNSRPNSVISHDATRLAKYNQDWTVCSQIVVLRFYLSIGLNWLPVELVF